MRKSDKLKNFKKVNLIVENRYLESKVDNNGIGGSQTSGLNEVAVVTDLENITFSYNGKHYRLTDVMTVNKVSNGLTVKFGMNGYKEGREFPTGNFLTYYMDYDNGDDKLLLTLNYDKTIDAKREIDPSYKLYDNIQKYVKANY